MSIFLGVVDLSLPVSRFGSASAAHVVKSGQRDDWLDEKDSLRFESYGRLILWDGLVALRGFEPLFEP